MHRLAASGHRRGASRDLRCSERSPDTGWTPSPHCPTRHALGPPRPQRDLRAPRVRPRLLPGAAAVHRQPRRLPAHARRQPQRRGPQRVRCGAPAPFLRRAFAATGQPPCPTRSLRVFRATAPSARGVLSLASCAIERPVARPPALAKRRRPPTRTAWPSRRPSCAQPPCPGSRTCASHTSHNRPKRCQPCRRPWAPSAGGRSPP
mmetsp:Transcript_111006/g.318994  ORF Transcript_111006/g.318994 Transcript_111006/m.318994 type:complete len:205 (+) Transcript_111006:62-676(+)